jgi:hypothetical protein
VNEEADHGHAAERDRAGEREHSTLLGIENHKNGSAGVAGTA